MSNFKLVLGSKSPRRQALIKELGFPVEIRTKEVEEIYPEDLPAAEVPEFLAKLKASPLLDSLAEDEILVTSDTIVVLNRKVIGKPTDADAAKRMIADLSGKTHTVITGVCLTSNNEQHTFSSKTKVFFSELTTEEINHYVDTFQPLDKAGSYGIQEWIGYIGVSKIEGCYYNVMGLPLHDLYRKIKSKFL
ncbi:MAG: Maf family nucleotide pyrophosphatase [Crocinitomicaceae bacterium]|nr:Maf family nucleotide pyrophosphatase [Crocinitomicaceae bacterium]